MNIMMKNVNNKNIFYIDIYTAHINISFTFVFKFFMKMSHHLAIDVMTMEMIDSEKFHQACNAAADF